MLRAVDWLLIVVLALLVSVLAVRFGLAQDPGGLLTEQVDHALDLPVSPPAPVTSSGAGFAMATAPAPREAPVDEPAPPTFCGETLEGSSVVYVVDRSGSMGFGRLDRAKQEVRQSVLELPADWSFSLVAFDHQVIWWSRQLEPATPEAKASALEWLGGVDPNGATETGPATAAALHLEPSTVVLLTDGAPTGAPARHRELIRANNRRPSRIDVFAIGATNPDYRAFCAGVAADSGGRFVDVVGW